MHTFAETKYKIISSFTRMRSKAIEAAELHDLFIYVYL